MAVKYFCKIDICYIDNVYHVVPWSTISYSGTTQ